MFNLKKDNRTSAGPRVYRSLSKKISGNFCNTKIVKYQGATVVFRTEPHPSGTDTIMYGTTVVDGLGLITVSWKIAGHSFSKGLPKTDYASRAATVAGAAHALAEFAMSDEIQQVLKIIVSANPELASNIPRLINELVMINATQAGIIVQPETGYSPGALIRSKAGTEAAMRGLVGVPDKPAETSSPPPVVPAPADPEAAKKKHYH